MKNNYRKINSQTIAGMQQNELSVNGSSAGVFEFVLGVLVVYIGGLWAVDLLPIKAARSVKITIDNFSYAYTFWIGAAVVALLIPLTLWKEKPHE